jgi:prepilin-type N-terminal cleavage/methylation domain-containing protein
MRNLKKGFTLVELIVVITILAILGTIAFISLQGYSAEARNSKRIQDLNSIAKAIQIKVANGSKLISFVGGTGSNGDFSVAGKTVVSTIDYQAGTPNYSAIGIKATDFQDPSSLDDYPVGVTTKKGGQYEIAASMENDSGNRVAKIV